MYIERIRLEYTTKLSLFMAWMLDRWFSLLQAHTAIYHTITYTTFILSTCSDKETGQV